MPACISTPSFVKWSAFRIFSSISTSLFHYPQSNIKLKCFRWAHYSQNFDSYRPCTLHLVCPCSKCSKLYHPPNFDKQFCTSSFQIFFLLLSLGPNRYWDTFSTVQFFHCLYLPTLSLWFDRAVKNVKWNESLAFIVHVKFSQMMSAISSSQRRTEVKLAQFHAGGSKTRAGGSGC